MAFYEDHDRVQYFVVYLCSKVVSDERDETQKGGQHRHPEQTNGRLAAELVTQGVGEIPGIPSDKDAVDHVAYDESVVGKETTHVLLRGPHLLHTGPTFIIVHFFNLVHHQIAIWVFFAGMRSIRLSHLRCKVRYIYRQCTVSERKKDWPKGDYLSSLYFLKVYQLGHGKDQQVDAGEVWNVTNQCTTLWESGEESFTNNPTICLHVDLKKQQGAREQCFFNESCMYVTLYTQI